MSVLAGMCHLADFLARTPVPAPHVLHVTYPSDAAERVRQLAVCTSTAGRLGLEAHATIGPVRSISGRQWQEVRLSWWGPDRDQPIEHGQAAAALRALAALAVAGEMPEPVKVDAMCALRVLGDRARLRVREAALLLGVRPFEGDGQVLVTRRIGEGASYTVHGFLR